MDNYKKTLEQYSNLEIEKYTKWKENDNIDYQTILKDLQKKLMIMKKGIFNFYKNSIFWRTI